MCKVLSKLDEKSFDILGGSVVKNLPANAEDVGSIPGQEDPWRRKWQPTPAVAWKIPWTEESGGYNPWGHKRVGHYLAAKQQYMNE